MRINKIYFLCLILTIFSCQKDEHNNIAQGGFLSFSTNGQTLPAAINTIQNQVRFEIGHDVDVTRLVPEFDVPEGCTVSLNGIQQVSGSSTVDFSQPVTYVLEDREKHSAKWQVSAITLCCKILIDASHDGGVWWFPQWKATGFNPDAGHQGQAFANVLREKGFVVDELGRDRELTEDMFFGYYIVIRANGLEEYTPKELEVYSKLVNRGMNMVFFTDHKLNDPVDELGDHLGIKFEGLARGTITTFKPHVITENISSISYVAGSALTNADQNPNIEVLGWLGKDNYADLNCNRIKDDNEPYAPPVMGILNYPKSRIFFIGDLNGLEIMPQPFIDNLIKWMGTCFK